jgi:tRNA(fMet)-specific endonuclease VapC
MACNIISALFKNNINVASRIQAALFKGDNIGIDAMVYYEIYRGLLAVNATSKMSQFGRFCNTYGVVLYDRLNIFEQASLVYATLTQGGQLIGDSDILIAALAISGNYVLVTDNVAHFSRVPGLKFENWLR